MKDIIISDDIM